MIYVIKNDERLWEEIPYLNYLTINGVNFSWETLELWDIPEREKYGIFTLEEPIAMQGKYIKNKKIVGVDFPTFEVEYEDIPDPEAPDNPSLRLWRTGLKLWRTENGESRFKNVDDAIHSLENNETPQLKVLGTIAREAFEYANTVDRLTLNTMRDAFGFTVDDVEESLWRAERVLQGDYSGTWPLSSE